MVVVVVVAAVAERMLEYTLDVVKLDPGDQELNIFKRFISSTVFPLTNKTREK